MRLRRYKDEDYPLLCDWWASRDIGAPDKEDLASGLGMVLEMDGEAKGACFLYVTGTIGIIEAIVMAPALSIRQSRQMADTLHQTLKEKAGEMGVGKLIAFVGSKGMVKECQRAGFSPIGGTYQQMIQTI